MRTAVNTPRRRWWAWALPVLGALGGCVVTPYGTYYRPSTTQPGARPGQSWCQGQTGPVTNVHVDLGAGLTLAARTERERDGGLPVQVLLEVPARIALRAEGSLQVRGADGALIPVTWTIIARRSVEVDVSKPIDPQPLRPGVGPQAARQPEVPHGTLLLRTEPVAAPLGEQVVVQGLAWAQSGRSVRLPSVTLTRPASARQPELYRSDAERAAIQARFDACRRDMPQLACGNIPLFSEDSDAGSQDGLRWRAHWERQRWQAGLPFAGELDLTVQPIGPWRIDASAWEVRDTASGVAHPLRLTSATLRFEDHVQLQQPLPAAEAATTIMMDTLLPPGTPSFDLLLPALRRDAKRVEIAPIRFERRTLDGGIAPFNC